MKNQNKKIEIVRPEDLEVMVVGQVGVECARSEAQPVDGATRLRKIAQWLDHRPAKKNLNKSVLALIAEYNAEQRKARNTAPLYESPRWEANLEKYGESQDACVCCAKPLKGDNHLMVHMNTDWLAVDKDVLETMTKVETGAESQGCFPIGSDCAKKMDPRFIIKNFLT